MPRSGGPSHLRSEPSGARARLSGREASTGPTGGSGTARRASRPRARARPPCARHAARRFGRDRAPRSPGSGPGRRTPTGIEPAASSSCTRRSRASTISAVTSVRPSTSLLLDRGAVATSAITTHRSRSRPASSSSSSAAAHLGPGQAQSRLGFVDGADWSRCEQSPCARGRRESRPVVPSSPRLVEMLTGRSVLAITPRAMRAELSTRVVTRTRRDKAGVHRLALCRPTRHQAEGPQPPGRNARQGAPLRALQGAPGPFAAPRRCACRPWSR